MNSKSSRKSFDFKLLPKNKLERQNIDGARVYVSPEGEKFKSVTSILGEKMDKTYLYEWRKRVGEAEANRISTQAAVRGTQFHTICEKYLLGEDYVKKSMPTTLDMFKQIRGILDDNVGTIYGLEHFLYSRRLQAAGTADLICEYDSWNSVVDFKTSRRIKKEEDIENYFLQATAYALMVEERYGFYVPQIVIIMAIDHEEPRVFVKQKLHYLKRVNEIFCSF